MRNRLLAVPATLAAMCVLPVAAADAHGFGHHGPFHSGYGWGQGGGWGHHDWSPTVKVDGVVTTAPASGADSFLASAYVASPPEFGTSPTAPTSTPGTMITAGTDTTVSVDGRTEPLSDLAVGDKFTAVYTGNPSETLATVVGGTPISIDAIVPPGFYGFVGTVTATSSDSVSVSVTTSEPSALFSGTDAFDTGPRTIVLGGSTSAPFGSISGVSVGDVVAGGLISQTGQTAAAIEADPLEFLIDFPSSTTATSSTGTTTSTASIRREQARAKALLLAEKKRLAKSAAKKTHKQVRHGK